MVEGRTGLSARRLKALFPISLVAAGLWTAIVPTSAQVNVTQFHNHSSRDGLYIDSGFTPSAAAKLTRDLNFDGTIDGNVFAQPLYIDNGPGGRPTIIAVTESNNVYALDAVRRQRYLGTGMWDLRYRQAISLARPNLIPWGSPARRSSILLHVRSSWTQ